MVEEFFVETRDLKSFSVVFVMTNCTFFTVNLYRSMIAFFSKNIGFYFFVTVKTFSTANFVVTHLVTLGTITHTFKRSMSITQIAGGNLGGKIKSDKQK